MVRFAVILFFFFQLVILLKIPRLAWAGRLVGWGTCALFLGMYVFQIEENSDILFILLAALTGISMGLAEIAAMLLKKVNV